MDFEVSNKVRIDKYLWAIRVFKTRSNATQACNDGKIKLDDETPVKASKIVKVGEVYSIKKEGKRLVINIIKIIENRVNASLASACYIDQTPEEEKEKQKLMSAFYFPGGKRGNKQARPTKKDRRKITELRGDI
ncbi:MAG TPA: S4 domain-containing protein [Bacteroidia bacterium]|nr:S4 domain-containing protein [Bacteroidia bacterium]